jgi:CubicO group peptidase (beta-lactamase class C family)
MAPYLRPLGAVLAGWLLCAPAPALAAKTVPPAAVDAVFATWNCPDSPGCAVGVMRAGHLVFARGYGRSRVPGGERLSQHSAFLVGSTSKQFTAATVVRLALAGKLSLDDPVLRYLPELGHLADGVTLRQMLHHESGLPDYLGLAALRGEYPPRLEDGVAGVLTQLAGLDHLNFAPGSQFAYSNTNFLLLGEVVHRVSGLPFAQAADHLLFRRLGMTHSGFFVDPAHRPAGLVTGYMPGPDGPRAAKPLVYPGGDGGLATTVEDLARWDAGFYRDRLGSKGRSVVAEMLRPGRLADGRTYDFASGLFLGHYRGLSTVSHPGGSPGFHAEILRFPEQRLTVVCLCNLLTINAAELARRVAGLYLADAFPEPPAHTVSVPSAELEKLAGFYLHPELGLMEVEADPKAGRLVALVHGVGMPALAPVDSPVGAPISESRFRSLFTPLPVELVAATQDGKPALRLEWPGQPPATFEKLEPATLPAKALDALAGEYRSAALGVSWRLERRGDGLVAVDTIGDRGIAFTRSPHSPRSTVTESRHTGR